MGYLVEEERLTFLDIAQAHFTEEEEDWNHVAISHVAKQN